MMHLNPYLVSNCTIMDTNREEISLIVLPEKHGGKRTLTLRTASA